MTEKPDAFDLGRHQFESWPWMFGKMFHDVVETARFAGGLEACTPQVKLLSVWCSQYMKPGERELIVEQAPGLLGLQVELGICMAVAQRKGAHDFRKEEVEAFEDTPAIPAP